MRSGVQGVLKIGREAFPLRAAQQPNGLYLTCRPTTRPVGGPVTNLDFGLVISDVRECSVIPLRRLATLGNLMKSRGRARVPSTLAAPNNPESLYALSSVPIVMVWSRLLQGVKTLEFISNPSSELALLRHTLAMCTKVASAIPGFTRQLRL